MEFIDTHAHLFLKDFHEDKAQIVQRALESKVTKIVLPNIDLISFPEQLSFANQFPGICYPTIGLHPCDVKDNYNLILDELELEFDKEKFIAIGETGTDAYWDLSFWENQIEAFNRQLEWAKFKKLPVIIHSRESIDQNIKLVEAKQDGSLKGVFHCFTGDLKQAEEIVALGFYLGIGGVITYKNSDLKNILPDIGLEHIVLETDSPFLSPVPFRGKRNESAYIPAIAEKISEILDLSLETVAIKTSENAERLFNFKQF
ncbi:MAG: TatD family hydrolase [Saprospiraceae bacterium]|nr:TatD family hydrolase [Saprospiraceae bacterium]HRG68763.1 TatD family hydrolase [Saprospiraceae bacterium]